MISNGEIREAKSEGWQWHYLAVKRLSALLIGMTSKHHGDFYCRNYPILLQQKKNWKKKIESHKEVGENKDFATS